MNRTRAIQEAKEMFPARGWLDAYTKAAKIPSEPKDGECPMCEDSIEWQTGTTGDGTEYSVPKCVSCDWEGDPQ